MLGSGARKSFGGIAQLVERLVRNEKARGSNPLTSSLRSQRSGERRLSRRSLGEGGHAASMEHVVASYGSASQPGKCVASLTFTFCKARATPDISTLAAQTIFATD